MTCRPAGSKWVHRVLVGPHVSLLKAAQPLIIVVLRSEPSGLHHHSKATTWHSSPPSSSTITLTIDTTTNTFINIATLKTQRSMPLQHTTMTISENIIQEIYQMNLLSLSSSIKDQFFIFDCWCLMFSCSHIYELAPVIISLRQR